MAQAATQNAGISDGSTEDQDNSLTSPESPSSLALEEAQHWEDALDEDDMELTRSHNPSAQCDLDPQMMWDI